MKEKNKYLFIAVAFLAAYYVPFEMMNISGPVRESLLMLQDYARNHMLTGIVPAFFLAGAISAFIKKESIIKYFGAKANKLISYSVASVSGIILAVCSCTVLPMFTSIYKRGAGIGPAITFLYSGPAINVLAIILTFRILGIEIGIARVVGAIVFSVSIGLIIHFLFYSRDEQDKSKDIFEENAGEKNTLLWRFIILFINILSIMILINLGGKNSFGIIKMIFLYKWYLISGFVIVLIYLLLKYFKKDEIHEWISESLKYINMIIPLLFVGIIIAGFLMGRPGYSGIVPDEWIRNVVGGNSLRANLFASIAGSMMYFCTLVEVPIVQSLMGSGMGKGPALALLLSGPALSLPNMIVVGSIIGAKKTTVYVSIVVLLATFSGLIFGYLF